jgi:hypothetical protein
MCKLASGCRKRNIVINGHDMFGNCGTLHSSSLFAECLASTFHGQLRAHCAARLAACGVQVLQRTQAAWPAERTRQQELTVHLLQVAAGSFCRCLVDLPVFTMQPLLFA